MKTSEQKEARRKRYEELLDQFSSDPRWKSDSNCKEICLKIYDVVEKMLEVHTLEDEFQKILDRERGMYSSAEAWEKGIKAELSLCAKNYYKTLVEQAIDEYDIRHNEPNCPSQRELIRKVFE